MTSHMFEGASGTITGGTFTIHAHSDKSALEKLSVAAARSALHDAPARTDQTRCHQGTRVNVIENLECWVQGILEGGAPVFWLQGGAGAGKSAIMQTLAERWADRGLALGSFFFSRSDQTRKTVEVLIPTLVYQLARLFPLALRVLDSIITHDPLILNKSFQVQFLGLFVPALQHLVKLGTISKTPQSPRVFLIDGLDECDGPSQQQSIIKAVAAVCYEHRIPVRFLIASRPEPAISTSFLWYLQTNPALSYGISLSEDPDAENDIRQFIEDEFSKICVRHPFQEMIPPRWPSPEDLDRLVKKSSSHFIYASTAVWYIWSARENPVRSLKVVLDIEISRTGLSPFPELDALYNHVLGSAAHRDKVLQILAHCVFAKLPSLTIFVCMILDCTLDDLTIFLSDMTPLITICHSARHRQQTEVKLLHASLGDFLRNKSRSDSLCIDEEVYLASTLERCFQLLDLRRQNRLPASNEEPYPTLVDFMEETIHKSAHMTEAQDLLRRSRHSIRNLFQFSISAWLLSLNPVNFFRLVTILVSLRRVETPDDRLFRDVVEDFFDTLELCASMHTPLGPAMLPLMFLGYPAGKISRILHYRTSFKITTFAYDYEDMDGVRRPLTFLDMMPKVTSICGAVDTSSEDLTPMRSRVPRSFRFKTGAFVFTIDKANEFMRPPAAMDGVPLFTAIRHGVDTSPQRLARAAEAILEHLFDRARLHLTPTYSIHRAWLRQTKAGKHIATGAPRLASVIHARCLGSLRLLEIPRFKQPEDEALLSSLRFISRALGLKHTLSERQLDRRRNELQVVLHLLDALLWVLPKASFSEKVVLYSKTTFPWNIYQRKPGLIRRVRKCLDRYATRMRNFQMQELDGKIAMGDLKALIEKSRMFYLDAQD